MIQKMKPIATTKNIKRKKQPPLREEMELQQHKEDLELINGELAQSRMELEAALRQYSDLYDFAPVGYFTLSWDGLILQIWIFSIELNTCQGGLTDILSKPNSLLNHGPVRHCYIDTDRMCNTLTAYDGEHVFVT